MQSVQAVEPQQNSVQDSLQPLNEPTPQLRRAATAITPNKPMLVTIPYQSLPQWVGIQKRLRLVPGITAVMPVRVSPSSAQVRIVTNASTSRDWPKSGDAGL